MRNLYRVDIEQRAYSVNLVGKRVVCRHKSYDVIAGTLESGIKRALSAAMKNGFLKSCPLEITKVERIASDIL